MFVKSRAGLPNLSLFDPQGSCESAYWSAPGGAPFAISGYSGTLSLQDTGKGRGEAIMRCSDASVSPCFWFCGYFFDFPVSAACFCGFWGRGEISPLSFPGIPPQDTVFIARLPKRRNMRPRFVCVGLYLALRLKSLPTAWRSKMLRRPALQGAGCGLCGSALSASYQKRPKSFGSGADVLSAEAQRQIHAISCLVSAVFRELFLLIRFSRLIFMVFFLFS